MGANKRSGICRGRCYRSTLMMSETGHIVFDIGGDYDLDPDKDSVKFAFENLILLC